MKFQNLLGFFQIASWGQGKSASEKPACWFESENTPSGISRVTLERHKKRFNPKKT